MGIKRYFNDFDKTLLDFVTYAALLKSWYCEKYVLIGVKTYFPKFGSCTKYDI